MMLLPLTFAIELGRTPAAPDDAWRIMRAAQRAVETATDRAFEREWTSAAARRANDSRALLALGELARLRYENEKADSLFSRILRNEPSPSAYRAGALAAMALWRTSGADAAAADTLFAQSRTEAQAAGDWHLAFQSLLGLAKLRSRRIGPKAAIELTREARRLAARPTSDESAQLLCTEGMLMEQAGDTIGRHRLDLGRRVAARGGALREEGVCDVGLATILDRSQFFDEAARFAANAVRIFNEIHFSYGAAAAGQWLGHSRLTRGYYAEARAELEAAIHDAAVSRFTQAEAWARSDLAQLYLALGDPESAWQNAERAAVLHSSYGDLWGFASDLEFEGFAAQARGSLDEACAKFTESVAAYRRAGLELNAVGALRQLALADMRAGRLDSAQRALDDASRLALAVRNGGWASELQIHLARLAMLRGDLGTADSLVSLARPHFAWRKADTTELWTLPFAVLEAQIALRTHRVATADSAIAFVSWDITRRRRGMTSHELRAGLAQLRGDWGGLSEAYPELVAGLASAGRLSSAFEFIERVRGREIADAALRAIGRMNDSTIALAGFRRLSSAAPVARLDDTRRRLSPDEALVVMTLGLAGAPTTAIVVTNDSAVAISLADRAMLSALIDRYLRIAATGVEPVAAGRQLGAALLQPITNRLPARVTRLEISADGNLYRVPFDALRLADDRYAVERYSISLVPSATVAEMLRTRRGVEGTTRVVAVGDPAFRAASGARRPATGAERTADTARFAGVSLPRLPQSADEARRVAAYGVRSLVLTRNDATEATVRKTDLAGVAVLHFATHALVDEAGQARTALALTPDARDDGFLTTSEIAALHLNGPLVVLSACQSLGGQILGGEGLRGLSGPFLEAGARAIVVTQWSIGDKSVLPFVDRFYANMSAGASVGDALRATKLAAIRQGARIADWAAFTVIGDASMRPPLRQRRLPALDWVHDASQPTRDTVPARP